MSRLLDSRKHSTGTPKNFPAKLGMDFTFSTTYSNPKEKRPVSEYDISTNVKHIDMLFSL